MPRKKKVLKVDGLVTQSINLVDKKGVTRGYMVSSSDAVVFQLCDETGKPRLSISLDPHGEPHIVFYAPDMSPALAMGAVNDGDAGFTITNAKSPGQILRLGISTLPFSKETKAGIVATDEKGVVTFLAPSDYLENESKAMKRKK